MNTDKIPSELKARRQIVLWRYENGTKVPYQVNGRKADSTDLKTWSTFDEAVKAFNPAKYSGIGYVFAKDDPFVGVDLDDCRDPASGVVADWAQEILNDLGSYAEISPSGTGVKVWVRGSLPIAESGRRVKYATGQVEAYQHSRYFAVTGQALGASDIREADVGRLWARVFDAPAVTREAPTTDLEQCRRDIAKIPDSISGERGHDRMLEVCCTILRWGYDLDAGPGAELLEEYAAERCHPLWSNKEKAHKIESAKDKVMKGNEFGIIANKAGAGFSLELVDLSDFMAEEIEQRFLVDRIAVANQFFMLGGPSVDGIQKWRRGAA